MKKFSLTLYFVAWFMVIVTACGCDKFDYIGIIVGQSPKINERFAQSMEYNSTHPSVTYNATRNDYSAYVITDIHASTSTTLLEKAVSNIVGDVTAEKFSVCLGDFTIKKGCFDIVCEAMKPMWDGDRTIFCSPGNHELMFGEWECYRKWFPSSSYVFFVKTPSSGTDMFISIDSSEGTLGTSQRSWLENTLIEASEMDLRHITVLTHTNFFRKDHSQGITSNYTTDETYDLLSLFAKYGVELVLTGHDHFYESTTFRCVKYLTLKAFVENEKSHGYYLFTFGDKISFSELSPQ